MANTIQSNIKNNTKDYTNFGYFLNGIDVTNQNLGQFTPYIQGVARIFMYRPPYFMEQQFPDQTKRFKTLLETGFTRIDGIGDISVEFVEFEGGFAGQRFSNVSLSRDDTDTITISVYEQSGSPVREYLDTWVTGTRDPRSGIAHYHNAMVDHPSIVKYGEQAHTAEFIYMTMDPTGKEIEYACMFAHAFPTKVPKSHLNYEKGNRDNVPIDIEMRVTKYESPAINQIAAWYLELSKVNYNYLDFTPNITNDQVKAAAISYGLGNS